MESCFRLEDSDTIEGFQAIIEYVLSHSAEKPENCEKVLSDVFYSGRDQPDLQDLIEGFREEVKSRKHFEVESLNLLRRLKLLAANDVKVATFVADFKEFSSTEVNNAELTKPSETVADVKKRERTIPQIAHITDAEMDTISSYMRGRLKVADINQFVDKINNTIVMKYELMRKPRKSLANDKWTMVSDFKLQETEATQGLFFCTKEDIQRLANYQFKNASNKFIEILRHCRRIREIREQKMVKFVCLQE